MVNTNTLTVVAVVTPEYIERLKVTLPTWVRKKQIAECPLILFGHKCNLHDLHFAKDYFKNVNILNWDWPGNSRREIVFSAFIFGTANIPTTHWVKIDADAFFVSDDDLFDEDDFKYDLCAQRWGYTKPSSWLTILDDWAELISLSGKPFLGVKERYEAELRNSYGHRRIISYCCLHKTEFTKKAAELFGGKLPVPSHDTSLFYLANRIGTWKGKNLKSRGVRHCSRLNSIKNYLKELKITNCS